MQWYVEDPPDGGAAPEFLTWSHRQLTDAYTRRTLSPVEVTQVLLDRARATQPTLNAFAHITETAALEAASKSEIRYAAGNPVSAIDGITVGIKELQQVAGLPVTMGSAALADQPPALRDGPAPERIREAGGVILGTTTVPDFAMLSSGVSSLHGITRSPWNRHWTVGGSSGGAGAALSAGIGAMHTGSDIGGSIRLPATWLGLVGFKPSHGRVPVDPPYLFRVAGPMARSTSDVAALLGVIARPDSRDYWSLPPTSEDFATIDTPRDYPRGLRVAVHLGSGSGDTDPQVAAAVRRAAETFAAHGALVTETDPPATAELLAAFGDFLAVKTLSTIDALGAERATHVHPFVREAVEYARTLTGVEVIDRYAQIDELRRRCYALLATYDLVLSPVAPTAAFPAEWPMPSNDPQTWLTHIGFTAPYNASGQPAVSVNCGFTDDGRPVGLQIAAPMYADRAALRASHWYEDARPPSAAPSWPI